MALQLRKKVILGLTALYLFVCLVLTTKKGENMVEITDYNESAGIDFLIPAKQEDTKPVECKIESFEMFKTQQGKEFPRMTLIDKSGYKFCVPAWTRDVAALCKEWGTQTDNWIQKNVEYRIENKKMFLTPLLDDVKEEKIEG